MIERKKTGSMVCPSCGKLISANSKECYNCGRKNPGLWGYGPSINKLLNSFNGLISTIVTVNIILYIIAILIDPGAILQTRGLFGLLAPSGQALDRLGMTGQYAIAHGRWWTLITAIYLHSGILHILFNMLWLRQLGAMVEDLFGTYRTFIIFTLSGVVGFVASFMFGIAFTIGASGSIFGLLGALVYYGRKRGGTFGSAIYRQVGMWAIILFMFGFMMSAVNNYAHAGGFIGGYLTAMWVGFHEQGLENQHHRQFGILLAVLTAISFVLVIFAH